MTIEKTMQEKWEDGGFDHYLEFQFRQTGDFIKTLFACIAQADDMNRARLARAFPSHVRAYEVWTQEGVPEFAISVSPDHPLLIKLKEEYNITEADGLGEKN